MGSTGWNELVVWKGRFECQGKFALSLTHSLSHALFHVELDKEIPTKENSATGSGKQHKLKPNRSSGRIQKATTS